MTANDEDEEGEDFDEDELEKKEEKKEEKKDKDDVDMIAAEVNILATLSFTLRHSSIPRVRGWLFYVS